MRVGTAVHRDQASDVARQHPVVAGVGGWDQHELLGDINRRALGRDDDLGLDGAVGDEVRFGLVLLKAAEVAAGAELAGQADGLAEQMQFHTLVGAAQ